MLYILCCTPYVIGWLYLIKAVKNKQHIGKGKIIVIIIIRWKDIWDFFLWRDKAKLKSNSIWLKPILLTFSVLILTETHKQNINLKESACPFNCKWLHNCSIRLMKFIHMLLLPWFWYPDHMEYTLYRVMIETCWVPRGIYYY